MAGFKEQCDGLPKKVVTKTPSDIAPAEGKNDKLKEFDEELNKLLKKIVIGSLYEGIVEYLKSILKELKKNKPGKDELLFELDRYATYKFQKLPPQILRTKDEKRIWEEIEALWRKLDTHIRELFPE
jgi:hypothetical protein